jgi:hypothetical protein
VQGLVEPMQPPLRFLAAEVGRAIDQVDAHALRTLVVAQEQLDRLAGERAGEYVHVAALLAEADLVVAGLERERQVEQLAPASGGQSELAVELATG